ncbi:hypothetical protein KH388_22230 [Serratia rubidaea]|nr:hypothetical protein [Serratia rubidaea]
MSSENTKPVNITTLTEAFKNGATPNEGDYGQLIDLAAVGSRALGADAKDATTPHPGKGLGIDANGRLAVTPGQGVGVDETGVSVNVDNQTLETTHGGLAIKLKASGGLDKEGGLHVLTGPGLSTGDGGLGIALADKSGLAISDNNSLAVALDKTSGLTFGDKGALKVNIKSGEDNYIDVKEDGLAITKEGVEAIKRALKEVSLDALKRAKENTDSGFKHDENTGGGEVETNIAQALNEAYAGGWSLQQAQAALTAALKVFRSKNAENLVINSVISLSALDSGLAFYAREGDVYQGGQLQLWRVNAQGECESVTGTDQITALDPGLYAVIGRVDKDGKPNKDEGLFTQHAVMVLAAEKNDDVLTDNVRTVVGHWDLLAGNEEWKKTHGAWQQVPTFDPLVYRKRIEDINRPKVSKPNVNVTGEDVTEVDLVREAGVTAKNNNDQLFFVNTATHGETWSNVIKSLSPTKGILSLVVGQEGKVTVTVLEAPTPSMRSIGCTKITVNIPSYPCQYSVKETLDINDAKTELCLTELLFTSNSPDPDIVTYTIEPTSTIQGATINREKLTIPEGTVSGSVVIRTQITPVARHKGSDAKSVVQFAELPTYKTTFLGVEAQFMLGRPVARLVISDETPLTGVKLAFYVETDNKFRECRTEMFPIELGSGFSFNIKGNSFVYLWENGDENIRLIFFNENDDNQGGYLLSTTLRVDRGPQPDTVHDLLTYTGVVVTKVVRKNGVVDAEGRYYDVDFSNSL